LLESDVAQFDHKSAGGIVEKKVKKQVCMLCGKPSPKSICDLCAGKVQGEVLNKRKKDKDKTQ
jgi:hypothetical protein